MKGRKRKEKKGGKKERGAEGREGESWGNGAMGIGG